MAEAPKIPQIIRERLHVQQTASQAGAEHPDADMLTAFSESALPAHERALLMSHLAACSACREVVLLSHPEASEAEKAATTSRRAPTWMAFRWAALAACLVLTLAVVLIDRSLRESKPSRAEQESAAMAPAPPPPPPAMAERESAPSEPKASSAPIPETRHENGLIADSRAKRRRVAPEKPKIASVDEQASLEAKDRWLVAKDFPSDKIFTAGYSSRGSYAGPIIGGAVGGRVGAAPAAPLFKDRESAAFAFGTVTRSQPLSAKPDLSGQRLSAQAATRSPQITPSAGMFAEGTADRDSSTNEMDRAFASNQEPSKKKTAEDTHVAGSSVQASALAAPAHPSHAASTPSPQASANNFQVAKEEAEPLTYNREKLATAGATPLQWRIRGGKLQQSSDEGKTWREVSVAPGISLRAFWSLGNSVWAGGTEGSLFHITDAGKNSVRIPITVGEGDVSQTVVSVTFSDELHGIVTLDNGQILQTADAGKTWERH